MLLMAIGDQMIANDLLAVIVGLVYALVKLVQWRTNGKKKSIPPPPQGADCHPCNEAVDRLATTMKESNARQENCAQRQAESVEKLSGELKSYLDEERGYRRAMRETGRKPAVIG